MMTTTAQVGTGARPTLSGAMPKLRRAGWTRRHLELRRGGTRTPQYLHRSLGTPQLPSAELADQRRVRVLIADDHEIVRQGLRAFLELDPALDVVGDATNGTEAVRLAHRLRPDVVLMDLVMPERDGIAATEDIRRELPDTKVVILTSMVEEASVRGAVRAGAIGYLLKDTRAPDLLQAIKSAAAGQGALSPQAAARLMRHAVMQEAQAPLSEREREVLRRLAHGSANKQIARDLGIAEKTVKTHVSSILGKLGLQSRTQAALYAGRVGLVPLEQLGEAQKGDCP
jgi:DNA-binding NarL/FixJ family response regulator